MSQSKATGSNKAGVGLKKVQAGVTGKETNPSNLNKSKNDTLAESSNSRTLNASQSKTKLMMTAETKN